MYNIGLGRPAWMLPFVLAQAILGSALPGRTQHEKRSTSPNSSYFLPSGLSLETSPQAQTSSFDLFTLSPTTPLATLEYLTYSAGYPFFEVSSVDGPVQIEVKYSEQYDGLLQPWSDGPYPFAPGLSNAFRVETFNITAPGTVTAFLLQGGQKWQSVRLLSGHSVSFSNVGFRASVETTAVDDLPGQFDCSDGSLNEIWNLGAKAATAACVDQGTQGPVWEIDPVNGAYVRSTRPAQSVIGAAFANYTLDFETWIDRGGSGWAVAWPLGYGSGIQLQLVGELPAETTFANVNTSLTPANSILLASGYSFINQTTLPAYYLDTFKVPFSIHEKSWYTISTTLLNGQLAVSVNGTQIFNVSLSNYYVGGGAISTSGSFGFGNWQDFTAFFRNAKVYDSANSSLIYSHPLTDQSALAEYGTQANLASVCLDGAKRDRLVWMGDFYHTSRIIGVSTSRSDHTQGTLGFLLESQISNGELNIAPAMGYDPSDTEAFGSFGEYGLDDYQLLGFDAFHSYVRASNDLEFVTSNWPQWQLQLDWLLSHINSTDGLVYVFSAFLGPTSGGSAVSCLAAQALRGAAEIATAINDASSAKKYRDAAHNLASSINEHLWNDDLGIYAVSPSNMSDYSVAGLSFCITSGVANSTQTTRSLSAIENLKLGPGYKDSTQVSSSDPTVNISPNTNGFLLEALFQGNASSTALALIKSLWGAMIANDFTSSGASWEYVDLQGNPGLSLFTSLSHPWGGAATYVLTEWAAGAQTAEGPEGFGYRKWVVDLSMAVETGLARASAKVVTAFGGDLEVSWQLAGEKVDVLIAAPNCTHGEVKLGNRRWKLRGQSEYQLSIDL